METTYAASGTCTVCTQCTGRTLDEPQSDYSARVLRYALTSGIEPLSLEQLEIADRAAQLQVSMLPSRLDADTSRVDDLYHTLRLRLAARMAEKRRQLAQEQRTLTALGLTQAPDESEPQTGADTAEVEADSERAARLLRAALVLIMGPPNGNGGGGRPATLIKPTPKLPPSGQTIDPYPPPTRGDDVRF